MRPEYPLMPAEYAHSGRATNSSGNTATTIRLCGAIVRLVKAAGTVYELVAVVNKRRRPLVPSSVGSFPG